MFAMSTGEGVEARHLVGWKQAKQGREIAGCIEKMAFSQGLLGPLKQSYWESYCLGEGVKAPPAFAFGGKHSGNPVLFSLT
jgi:hypothetical protein